MRTLLPVAAVLLAAAASPAVAAPKPITKTYTATAPVPDPTNAAPNAPYTVCPQVVPQSFQVEAFKAPAPGKLAVEVSGIQGDWDLLITDAKGAEVGSSGNGGYGTPAAPSVEKATVKVKKGGVTYSIVACNWAGAPTATVKYTFTYA
ncbi:MAG TPA: hypothetical protein VF519_06075 [Mycobacteriales bacterium]|jgi:hypothetical protein